MQNACMTTITIRDVPEDTHAELVKRAAAQGKSLQEYIRQTLIDRARKPDMTTLMARVEERVKKYPSTLTSEQIVDLIRAQRGE